MVPQGQRRTGRRTGTIPAPWVWNHLSRGDAVWVQHRTTTAEPQTLVIWRGGVECQYPPRSRRLNTFVYVLYLVAKRCPASRRGKIHAYNGEGRISLGNEL